MKSVMTGLNSVALGVALGVPLGAVLLNALLGHACKY